MAQALGPFTNNVFESEKKHYVTLFVLAEPASDTLKNDGASEVRRLGMVRVVRLA